MNAQRNYGIDLLRILSMLAIPVLHLLGHGNVLEVLTEPGGKFAVAWLAETSCFWTVNVYAMITGYVRVSGKKYGTLLRLWLTVLFWSLTVLAVFALFLPDFLPAKDEIIPLFFPTLTKRFWYFSSYFVLFLFLPFLRNGLDAMNEKQRNVSMILLFVFLTVAYAVRLFSSDVSYDFFDLDGIWGKGYSVWWLLVCYLIGDFLSRRKTPNINAAYFFTWISVFVGATLLPWGLKLLLSVAHNPYAGALIEYTSPFIVLQAVSLLMIFSRISLSDSVCRSLSVISPLTFSVYLLHEHPLIRDRFIVSRFRWIADLPTAWLVPAVLGCAVAIFLAGVALDALRSLLFRLCRIDRLCKKIDEKTAEI